MSTQTGFQGAWEIYFADVVYRIFILNINHNVINKDKDHVIFLILITYSENHLSLSVLDI